MVTSVKIVSKIAIAMVDGQNPKMVQKSSKKNCFTIHQLNIVIQRRTALKTVDAFWRTTLKGCQLRLNEMRDDA